LKTRLFSYYRLLPYSLSDSNSLLFSAAYLCRLIAPMAYNFLLMSGFGGGKADSADGKFSPETATFVQVMGTMNLAPFLGAQFSSFFPIFLIVFAFLTFFNVYTRCTQFCCTKRLRKFSFDIDFDDEHTRKGRDLVNQERDRRVRQLREGSGEATDLLSSGHLPEEASEQQQSSAFPSVFQRIVGSLGAMSPRSERHGHNGDDVESGVNSMNSPSSSSADGRRGIVASGSSDSDQHRDPFVSLDDAIEDAAPQLPRVQTGRRGILGGR
jgi:LMBR1-like membrane protein